MFHAKIEAGDVLELEPFKKKPSALPAIIVFLLLGGLAIAAINLRDSDWGSLLSRIGIEQPKKAPATISVKEKNALVAMADMATEIPALTGDDALAKNAALPFAEDPILAAKPFAITNVYTGAGLTALQCLTQAVYYEAAYEPIAGRRAVAQVVLNRMRHPAFPNSVCGVVYQGSTKRVCQFSFTCDGSLNRVPARGAWAESEAVAIAALSGYVERSVGQATHYHANYVSPYWAPNLVKLAQIRTHIFYRWPGKWGLPAAFTARYSGVEGIPAATMLAAGELPVDGALPLTPEAAQTIDQQTEALARATLAPELVPMRAAENDVGGRLDISKGWTLKIPDPRETRGASAAVTARQAGADGSEARAPMEAK
jgi:spore germination cell wall hydrolase CwlJ-like protein